MSLTGRTVQGPCLPKEESERRKCSQVENADGCITSIDEARTEQQTNPEHESQGYTPTQEPNSRKQVENMNEQIIQNPTKGGTEQKSHNDSKNAIAPEFIIFQNSDMVLIDKHKQNAQERTAEMKNVAVQFYISSTNTDDKVSPTPSTVSSADSENFDSKLTRFLYRLWKKKTMCNMAFNVNGKAFPAHRVALAANSDKYTGDFFMGVPVGTFEINLLNISEAAIKEVMHYMYTSEIRVTYQNVDGIICCADQLSMYCAIQICKNFLLNCGAEYVLQCLPIAKKYHFQDVITKLETIACENFNTIMTSHHFLRTHVDHIKQFVCSEQLSINSELDVLYAIANWISYCLEDRMKYAPKLMRCVRFVLIPNHELAAAFNGFERIFEIPECTEMIKSAFTYHTAKKHGCRLLKHFPEVKARMPCMKTNIKASSCPNC